RGSKPACGSPRLFAACHVLPRLPAPRHPPRALPRLASPLSMLHSRSLRTSTGEREASGGPRRPGAEHKAEPALSHTCFPRRSTCFHNDTGTLSLGRASACPTPTLVVK